MTNIDELFQQLPVEKTSVDFTAKVMDKIAELPICERGEISRLHYTPTHHLSAWAIVAICLGGLAVLVGGWWAADYFFEWDTLYVKPFLQNTGNILSSIFAPIFHAQYSPMVISGMLIGVILLFIDAAIRKRISKHQSI